MPGGSMRGSMMGNTTAGQQCRTGAKRAHLRGGYIPCGCDPVGMRTASLSCMPTAVILHRPACIAPACIAPHTSPLHASPLMHRPSCIAPACIAPAYIDPCMHRSLWLSILSLRRCSSAVLAVSCLIPLLPPHSKVTTFQVHPGPPLPLARTMLPCALCIVMYAPPCAGNHSSTQSQVVCRLVAHQATLQQPCEVLHPQGASCSSLGSLVQAGFCPGVQPGVRYRKYTGVSGNGWQPVIQNVYDHAAFPDSPTTDTVRADMTGKGSPCLPSLRMLVA